MMLVVVLSLMHVAREQRWQMCKYYHNISNFLVQSSLANSNGSDDDETINFSCLIKRDSCCCVLGK